MNAAAATSRPVPKCWRRVYRDERVKGRVVTKGTLCGGTMEAVESGAGALLGWRCAACCYVGLVDASGRIV